MSREITICLACCGSSLCVVIDDGAIRALEPNEIRKTFECSSCRKIVVLDFSRGLDEERIEQEIVDLDPA